MFEHTALHFQSCKNPELCFKCLLEQKGIKAMTRHALQRARAEISSVVNKVGRASPLYIRLWQLLPAGVQGWRAARTSRRCPWPAFPRLLLSKCSEDSLRDSEHPQVFREKGTRGHRASPMPNSGSALACDDIHSSKTIVFTPNPLACGISPVL